MPHFDWCRFLPTSERASIQLNCGRSANRKLLYATMTCRRFSLDAAHRLTRHCLSLVVTAWVLQTSCRVRGLNRWGDPRPSFGVGISGGGHALAAHAVERHGRPLLEHFNVVAKVLPRGPIACGITWRSPAPPNRAERTRELRGSFIMHGLAPARCPRRKLWDPAGSVASPCWNLGTAGLVRVCMSSILTWRRTTSAIATSALGCCSTLGNASAMTGNRPLAIGRFPVLRISEISW